MKSTTSTVAAPPAASTAPATAAPARPPTPVPCAEHGGPAAPSIAAVAAFAVPPGAATATPDDPVEDLVHQVTDSADPVLVLHAGSYPAITIAGGGPLTIVGDSRDDVIVAGFVLDGARDVTVSSLTIAGNEDPASSAVTITGRSSGIRLSDVTIDPAHNAGVDIVDGSRDITIEHSRITGEHVTHKLGPARNIHVGEGSPDTTRWVEGIHITDNELLAAGADGIQVAGARDVTIARNFIHDLQQNKDHNDGIQVVAVDGATIEANTLTSLTATSQDQSIILGHLGGGAGPAADPALRVRDVVVANNLVHHWAGAGITVNGTIDVTIVNNTSMDNGRDGQPFPGLLIDSRHAPNEGLTVINNVVSDIQLAGTEPATVQAANVVAGAGGGPEDRTGDPCFADRTDYQLAPQSPAIDLGIAAGAPTDDLDGRPRDRARPMPARWNIHDVAARGHGRARAGRAGHGRVGLALGGVHVRVARRHPGGVGGQGHRRGPAARADRPRLVLPRLGRGRRPRDRQPPRARGCPHQLARRAAAPVAGDVDVPRRTGRRDHRRPDAPRGADRRRG